MNDRIPIIIPDVEFGDVEHDFKRILTTGILTSGPYVVDFERSIADHVGVDHAVATLRTNVRSTSRRANGATVG